MHAGPPDPRPSKNGRACTTGTGTSRWPRGTSCTIRRRKPDRPRVFPPTQSRRFLLDRARILCFRPNPGRCRVDRHDMLPSGAELRMSPPGMQDILNCPPSRNTFPPNSPDRRRSKCAPSPHARYPGGSQSTTLRTRSPEMFPVHIENTLPLPRLIGKYRVSRPCTWKHPALPAHYPLRRRNRLFRARTQGSGRPHTADKPPRHSAMKTDRDRRQHTRSCPTGLERNRQYKTHMLLPQRGLAPCLPDNRHTSSSPMRTETCRPRRQCNRPCHFHARMFLAHTACNAINQYHLKTSHSCNYSMSRWLPCILPVDNYQLQRKGGQADTET